MKPSKLQWAVTHKRKYSSRNDEHYYEIEFIDNNSGRLRKTYAAEENFNFGMWEQLIGYMEDHPGKAICIEGEFHCKRGKKDIINADVTFGFVEALDLDDFMNAVESAYYA